MPAGRGDESLAQLSEQDAVQQFRDPARGGGAHPPDGRRAARHVPLRRPRQQRHRRADGEDDRPAAADLLGRVQAARVQRARLRAAGVDRDQGRRARDRHRRPRLLRRAAPPDLARGRADRAPLERAALFRVGARPRARQGRAHRRRQRRAARRLRQVSAGARQLARRRRLQRRAAAGPRAGSPTRSCRGCRGAMRRYASRSFLAMARTPEAMFFDNFAAIGLARQRTLLVAAIRGRRAGGRLRAVARSTSTRRTATAPRSTACSTPTSRRIWSSC